MIGRHEDAERVAGRVGQHVERLLGVARAVLEFGRPECERPIVLAGQLVDVRHRHVEMQLLRHDGFGPGGRGEFVDALDRQAGGAARFTEHEPVVAVRIGSPLWQLVARPVLVAEQQAVELGERRARPSHPTPRPGGIGNVSGTAPIFAPAPPRCPPDPTPGAPCWHSAMVGRIRDDFGKNGVPMSDPIATLSRLLEPVFAEINGGAPADPIVRPSDRADVQINGALPLAKALGSNPREIAERVIASGALAAAAAEAEIAGPGFINVNFSRDFITTALGEVATDERLGVPPAVTPKTVVVDYSAPNVAKEMHVGHLRSTVIGDALVRMHDFLGHRVIRENHVGDWGRPFGMLIEHLLDLGEDVAADGLSQGDLDGFYKQANAKFAESAEFQERARERVVLLQRGDEETTRLWHRLVDMSTVYFNTVYGKLGVLLTDDDIAGESMYQPLMDRTVERLAETGSCSTATVRSWCSRPGSRTARATRSR